MKKKNKIIALVEALLSSLAICFYLRISVADIFSIIIVAFCIHLFVNMNYDGDKRKYKISTCGAMLFATMMTLGQVGKTKTHYFDIANNFIETLTKDERYKNPILMNGYSGTYYLLIEIIIFIGLFFLFRYILWKILECISVRKFTKINIQHSTKKNVIIVFICSLFIIFLAWLPYLILLYPGILSWDSYFYLEQAIGSKGYFREEAFIWAALIRQLYKIGATISGTADGGVCAYVIAQMFIMSGIYAYIISYLYKIQINKKIIISILLYYAFFPLHAIYSIIVWKDILFSGLILWFSLILFKLYITLQNNEKSKGSYFELVICTTLMMLFRSNGRYAYILILPFLIILFYKKIKYKCILFIIPLVLLNLITAPLDGRGATGTLEGICMPLQHISRVIVDEKPLTSEEKALIEAIAPLNEIKNSYNPRTADPIKVVVDMRDGGSIISDNAKVYFKLWIKLGLKYPGEYILAQIDSTVGFWYPDILSKGFYGSPNVELGIYQVNPNIDQLGKIFDAYKFLPIIGILYSAGAMFWILLLCGIVCIYKKEYYKLVFFLPVSAIWVTLQLASPLFAETRYIYCIFTTIPLIIVETFWYNSRNIITEEKTYENLSDSTSI